MSKKALRKSIAATLAQLSPATIASQSTKVAKTICEMPEYAAASRIAVYLHMDQGEARTDDLLDQAFKDNKKVFLPRIVPLASDKQQFAGQKTHLRMLECTREEIEALQPKGRFNLREPDNDSDCFDHGGLDLIIVPGVGFTARCERMGHGKGFYDSFIAEHRSRTDRTPILIGMGLSEQLTTELPVETHDKVLDAVVLGGDLYRNI